MSECRESTNNPPFSLFKIGVVMADSNPQKTIKNIDVNDVAVSLTTAM